MHFTGSLSAGMPKGVVSVWEVALNEKGWVMMGKFFVRKD